MSKFDKIDLAKRDLETIFTFEVPLVVAVYLYNAITYTLINHENFKKNSNISEDNINTLVSFRDYLSRAIEYTKHNPTTSHKQRVVN